MIKMNDTLEKATNIFNGMFDDIQEIYDWLTEKPKLFYRKFRCGKKIYKTRKMFEYNSIKNDLIIPSVALCTKVIRRRLNEKFDKI